MKTCRPIPDSELAEFRVCEFSLICQRCGFCIVHCTCPPPELRAETDDYKRVGKKGSLVLTPRRPSIAKEDSALQKAAVVFGPSSADSEPSS